MHVAGKTQGSRWGGLAPGARREGVSGGLELPRDEYTPGQSREDRKIPWGKAAMIGLALGAPVLVSQLAQPAMPQQVTVTLVAGKVAHLPVQQRFEQPLDGTRQEFQLRVKVPAHWSEKGAVVVALRATDSQGRSQSTRWTEGQATAQNVNYDAASGTLTLRYRPSSAEVDEQGRTQEGFDPTEIQQIALQISPQGNVSNGLGTLELGKLERHEGLAPRGTAETLPLLGPPSARPSLRPDQVKAGVSRYFRYADLHRWNEVKGEAEGILAAQQKSGLHAFRLMGGLDLRGQAEQGPIAPEVFQATREFFSLCEKHQQDQLIFTLLDGAIPNPTLHKAISDPQARGQLMETLRPYVREFGHQTINAKPVIFDLVNEIHGAPGSEADKQALIHEMVDLFVHEAPGAHLTVGVQNYRELKYWTPLLERFADKPVHFHLTFHLYEDIENLPNARDLNIPAHVSVGITEAQPQKGMAQLARRGAEKGYDWMLFWADSGHPYDPAQHRSALQP